MYLVKHTDCLYVFFFECIYFISYNVICLNLNLYSCEQHSDLLKKLIKNNNNNKIHHIYSLLFIIFLFKGRGDLFTSDVFFYSLEHFPNFRSFLKY